MMTFETWVSLWFDHPESERDFWLEDPPEEIEDSLALELATLLFTRAGEVLAPYSSTQIGNSLWGLINEIGCPLYCLQNELLPATRRIVCIDSIFYLFRDVVAQRGAERLGNLSEPGGSLEMVCYMWWDIFPAYPGCFLGPERQAIEDAVLHVQEKVLMLPHSGCQESALHGLGHWSRGNERKVEAIIDRFLASHQVLRPELVSYAQLAREGLVL
jgi:hypothetical protein